MFVIDLWDVFVILLMFYLFFNKRFICIYYFCLLKKFVRNDLYLNFLEDVFNYIEKRILNFFWCVGKFFFSYL